MSELSYLKVFLDWIEATEKLNDADKGRLIDAMVRYARGEENADSRLKGNEAYLFPIFRLQIDRDKAEIEKKRQTNAENGSKGGAPKGNQNARKNNRKQPKTTETSLTKTRTNDKDKDKDKEDTVCAEPRTASAPETMPPCFQIPLNDGTFWSVSAAMISHWQELYPAVDVEQQIRGMIGWCESNPKKRKTANGVSKFVTNWLAREQNWGGGQQSQRQPAYAPGARKSSNPFADLISESQRQIGGEPE